MNEEEKKVVRVVVKQMKNAHEIIFYWLKGSIIEKTLDSWIKALESLL